MRCFVRDNEQNVMTFYMDTVKYAAPVEMQNPLKSWTEMTVQHDKRNGTIPQLVRHLTFRCRRGWLSEYANGFTSITFRSDRPALRCLTHP